MRFFFFLVLILFLLLVVAEAKREYRRLYYGRSRHAKQIRRYVHSSLDCEIHEYFQRCGPEAHCELTCENFVNPPNCQSDYSNPKCYYPRCICESGYVRDRGRCVLENYCTRHHHHHKRRLFK